MGLRWVISIISVPLWITCGGTVIKYLNKDLHGTSHEKLYVELGWATLSGRWWNRRLTLYYNILNGQDSFYLNEHIEKKMQYFNFQVSQYLNIDSSLFALVSGTTWRITQQLLHPQYLLKNLLNLFRPNGSSYYRIRDKSGIMLTKIRVGYSDLRDYRYNHIFNCENLICSCGVEDEIPVHYFLCCLHYTTKGTTFTKQNIQYYWVWCYCFPNGTRLSNLSIWE